MPYWAIDKRLQLWRTSNEMLSPVKKIRSGGRQSKLKFHT